MAAAAVFPAARPRAGMYESFYLRAVSPSEPVGVWIRHTVFKAPGAQPRGAVWFTLFRAGEPPLQHKVMGLAPSAGVEDWIALDGSAMRADGAEGRCGPASWRIAVHPLQEELRHLSPSFLYRTPLPRTKLTSPAPAARFDGKVDVEGAGTLSLDGWLGMVGHNWGAEHAERWIWLHGIGFAEDPDAWVDLAVGRLRIGGRLTPWAGNGALFLGDRRHRLGGLTARVGVQESARGCQLEIGSRGGLRLHARVGVPEASSAGWRYADPKGGEHDVLNCSIASIALRVEVPGEQGTRTLTTGHGGAYELGVREHDHGVAIAPFADG